VEYKISLSGVSKELFLKLCSIPYPCVDRKYANERSLQDDKFIILPIKSITRSFYSGKLVDIQVKNTNDFVAENVVVHNSWIEAMATKTPLVMPRNTAMTEFITEDRGYLVDSGTNASLWTVLPHDNEVLRPLVDVDDMVKTLVHVYNNRDEAKKKAENAYKWVVKDMDWQGSIADKWVKLFDKVADTIGKDDPTPSIIDNVINAEEF